MSFHVLLLIREILEWLYNRSEFYLTIDHFLTFLMPGTMSTKALHQRPGTSEAQAVSILEARPAPHTSTSKNLTVLKVREIASGEVTFNNIDNRTLGHCRGQHFDFFS